MMGKHRSTVLDSVNRSIAPDLSALPRGGRLTPVSGVVGRVGALAVALGVGIAVINSPGIALAETGDGETGSNTTDTQPDPAPAEEADPVEEGPVEEEPEEQPADEDENVGEEKNLGGDEQEAATELVVPTELTPEVITELTSGTNTTPTPVAPPPPAVVVPPAPQPGSNEQTIPPAESPVIAPPVEVVAPETKSTDAQTAAVPDAFDASAARVVPEAGEQSMLMGFDASAADTVTVSALETQVPQPMSSALAAPAALISTVVSALLAPLLAPIGPAAPAQTPILWAVLAWVRRQVEHTFNNKGPVIVNNNDTTLIEPDTVTGTVTAYDPDPEDRVGLTTTGGNPDADITIAPDGTWTYTAPQDWDGTTTHTDSFTITATEYRGGFLGLIAPRGRTTSTTVNVSIDPTVTDQAPVAVDDVDSTLEDTEATGNVLANDTDIDTPASGLSVTTGTVTTEQGGTITFESNGDYTYTPTTDFAGVDSVEYTMTDGISTDTAELAITVLDDVVVTALPVPDGATSVNAVMGADGTAAQTAVTGDGSVDSPYYTHVTAVATDGTVTSTAPIPGRPAPTTGGGPGQLLSGPGIGADGTVAQVIRTGTGTTADPYQTRLAVIAPDGTVTVTDPVPGTSVDRGAVVAPDGTAAMTTYSGAGTVADPIRTRVTVVSSDGTITTTDPVLGQPFGGVVVGDNGTAAQLTYTSSGGVSNNPPYNVRITTVAPDGTVSTSDPVTINSFWTGDGPGGINGPGGIGGTGNSAGLVVGADGTVAYTTTTNSGPGGATGHTRVTVIAPDGTATTTDPVVGSPVGVVLVREDGTVFQATGSTSGTRVVVIAPNGTATTTNPVVGSANHSPVLGANGVAYLPVRIGTGSQASPYRTQVALIDSDGTVTMTNSVYGYPNGPTVPGPNGLAYQVTTTGSGDDAFTLITVIAPDGTIVTPDPIFGQADRPLVVGSDGTAVQTVRYQADATATRIVVVTPDGTVTFTDPVPDSSQGPAAVGADGTVYQSTYTGTFDEADPFFTRVTVISAEETVTTGPILGYPTAGLVLGPDGTAYQVTVTGYGTSDPPETLVTSIAPDGTTTTADPIPGEAQGSVVVADDGSTRLLVRSGTGTSSDPYRYAVTTVTPASALL